MVPVSFGHAAPHVLKERGKFRHRSTDVRARVRHALAVHPLVLGVRFKLAAGRKTCHNVQPVRQGGIQRFARGFDQLRFAGRQRFAFGPDVAHFRMNADVVGESDVLEPRHFIIAGAPHDHRHLPWHGSRHDAELRALLGAVAVQFEAGAQRVNIRLQGRVDRFFDDEILARFQALDHRHLFFGIEVQVDLGVRHGRAAQIGHDDLHRLEGFHATPHTACAGNAQCHLFKAQDALADAHLINVAGKPAVVAAKAVSNAQRLGARCYRSKTWAPGDTCGTAIQVKLAFAGAIIGERQVMPRTRLQFHRQRVKKLRFRTKAQVGRHATHAPLVGLAQHPLVVGVIHVLLVEQERSQFGVHFRLGVHPHLQGETRFGRKSGLGAGMRAVVLVLHGIARKRFQRPAELAFRDCHRAVKGEIVAFARAVHQGIVAIKLPITEHVGTRGVVLRITRLPGFLKAGAVSRGKSRQAQGGEQEETGEGHLCY